MTITFVYQQLPSNVRKSRQVKGPTPLVSLIYPHDFPGDIQEIKVKSFKKQEASDIIVTQAATYFILSLS